MKPKNERNNKDAAPNSSGGVVLSVIVVHFCPPHGRAYALAKNMIPIREPSSEEEPEWDSFGIKATDFRPHWDGHLVNVFSTITPQKDIAQTERFAVSCARQLADWVVSHRSKFAPGDRFQIIIGWPKSIRMTARQIIKAGGN